MMTAQISGERRLPVRRSDGFVPRRTCTVRQLAGRNHDYLPRMALLKMFAASCRKLQADSLCSPEL